MDTKPIRELSFPSVSVCHSWSWTWPNVVGMIGYLSDEEVTKESLARLAIGTLKKYLEAKSKSSGCKDMYLNLTLNNQVSDIQKHSFYFSHFYLYHYYQYTNQSSCGPSQLLTRIQDASLAFSFSKLLSNGSRKI